MPMIAITTSNSIKVNARIEEMRCFAFITEPHYGILPRIARRVGAESRSIPVNFTETPNGDCAGRAFEKKRSKIFAIIP
jgi:hypothetical protein